MSETINVVYQDLFNTRISNVNEVTKDALWCVEFPTNLKLDGERLPDVMPIVKRINDIRPLDDFWRIFIQYKTKSVLVGEHITLKEFLRKIKKLKMSKDTKNGYTIKPGS